ncbi:hypothetical protein Daus18300_013472 [Diaporthe australafricana]|uniref:Uncharacterized protein n=1 Tax=Diaporthe australafricana TaxID=127596 RepID=A0ABR3VYW4_9PEZI
MYSEFENDDQDFDAWGQTSPVFGEDFPENAEADLDDLWETVRNYLSFVENFGVVEESKARAHDSDRELSTVHQRIYAPDIDAVDLRRALMDLFADDPDKELVQVKMDPTNWDYIQVTLPRSLSKAR